MQRPRGNGYRGPTDLRCRGFTPGPNSEPGAKAGYLTIRFNTRFTCGAIHAPSPRAVRISLAWSPAAICLNDVAPSACSSAIGGAISAALADALLAGRSGLYAHLHGWLDATVTAQLRTARLGGGDRRLRTHAEHARCPRRAVEPSRFRWLVAGTDCRVQFALNAPSSGGANATLVALQAGVG